MTGKRMTVRSMPEEDILLSGHAACAGCGMTTAVNNVMRIVGPNSAVYVPACCLLVASGQYPTSAFNVPFLYSAFENTGAVIAGMKAGFRRQGKDVTVVGFAGDGGTFDIGLQALAGAAERNDDVLYVCVDNEAYMNTGTQRSGSTPFGAWTTTTPVGKEIRGKRSFKKDLMCVVTSQDIAYAATLSISHMQDFITKVEKAKHAKGFRFLHILVPCVSGWKYDPAQTYEISRLAVETGMWSLYEHENGETKVTYRPKEMVPVIEYLKLQGRFKHMNPEEIEILQKWVCKKWDRRYRRHDAEGQKLEEEEKPLAMEGELSDGI